MSGISNVSKWEDPAHAQVVGPPLPAPLDPLRDPLVNVVQVAGGHTNPTFYVGNGVTLRVLDATRQWRVLVPGGPPGRAATKARRFFVDPFNASLIYVLDSDAFRVSLDGGASWLFDDRLTDAIAGGGKLAIASSGLVRDMLFVRSERFTRFVLGSAGIGCTTDGIQWHCLLYAVALGGYPESAFFDGITDPGDRTLYVQFEGRGLMRLSGVPAPVPRVGADFSLMELEA